MATDNFADLQRWREPPVFRLLSTGTLFSGSHINKTWRGLAQTPGSHEAGLPMLVKYMARKPVIAAELACAVAARALKLQVPGGSLVIAQRDQLPGLPNSVRGSATDLVLCYGSEYKFPDDTVARPTQAQDVEEWIWRRLCHTAQGPIGGVWDELVANDDRHCENVVYDGANWWLIDHEASLPSVAKAMKKFAEAQARQSVIDEKAAVNTLAHEVLTRRPNDHKMDALPAHWQTLRKRLSWLGDQAQAWRTPMPEVNAVLEMAHLYLRGIELRLPALALHLSDRMQNPESASLWNSYKSSAPATPRKTTLRPRA
ncbi:MAG: hypothetical protein ACKVIH_01590 [Burkholderiales bacterium]